MADNAQLPADGLLVATDELTTINGQAAPAGLQVQRAKVGFGAEGDFNDVTDSTPLPVADTNLPTIAGTAGTSPPTPAAGATGILGWLRGIFDKVVGLDGKMPALVGGKVPVDIGSANLTLSGEVEVKNDTGNPVPVAGTVAVSNAILPTGAATANGQAAIISALGTPLQEGGTVGLDAPTLAALENITATVSGPLALDAPTLAALENVTATISGPVALDSATLAALENTSVTLEALVFPASTNNSSTGQLQPNATFVGVIETVQNLQAAQVQVVCDQPYTLVINQYIDAAGLELTESTTFRRAANQPLCLNVLLPGNFFNLALTNNGIQETEALHIDVTFGIMDTLPKTLGQKVRDESMAVTLSVDDVDLLNDIRNALAPLMSARGLDGALRIFALGGSMGISSLPTLANVTTVATVTTVGTVGNQTAMGSFQANPQIPALMNLAAASNIDRMVG